MALCHELARIGVPFERQKDMPVRYKDAALDCGYRIDLLVAGELLIDLKSVESLLPIHEAQLLTYLKLARKPLGLLLNFNVRLLKHGLNES
jgi:GxxExxY protein